MQLIRLTATILLAIAAAFPIVLDGRSAIAVNRGNGVFAVALRPKSPAALTALGEQLITAGRYDDAVGAAADALRAAPLNQQASRIMGLALTAAGRTEQGQSAMLLAAAMGWRDNPTLLWQMRHALERGDMVTALHSADAMARRRRAPAEAFATIRRVAFTPGSTPLVGAVLRDGPPWRRDFLGDVTTILPMQFTAFEHLLAAGRVSADDMSPYLWLLVDHGETGRAYALYRRVSGRPRPDGALAIRDFTGFPRPFPSPFDWIAGVSGDFATASAPLARGGTTGLSVTGSAAVAQPVVTQILIASPGRHVLSVEQQGAGTGGPLAWSVTCLSGATLPMAVTVTDIGDGWQRVDHRFTVPAGCTAQRVMLAIRPAGGGDATRFAVQIGSIML